MKNIVLLLCVFSFLGCHKHGEETGAYVVNITINKPIANQVVSKNTTLPINVFITRDNNAVIHNVKIEITDAMGATIETLINKHYHESGKVTFNDTYTPKNTGNFKLKVTSTADIGEEPQPNISEVAFIVN